MKTATQVATNPIYQRSKPVRNRQYLRFVKRFPCVACGGTWRVDPFHTGSHGIGQKSSDMGCLPLCRRCHDAFDAAPRDFAVTHQLDIPALIQMFQHMWDLRQGRTA